MRPPTLFDKMMAGSHPGPGPNVYRAAQRFVLDDEASRFVGDLVRRSGTLLLSQHEFARPPFPITWIEMNHREYWSTLTGRTPSHDSDLRCGVLIHDGVAYVATDGGPPEYRDAPLLAPMRFHLGEELPPMEELALAEATGFSRMTFRQAMVGMMYDTKELVGDDRAMMDDDVIRDVVRSNRVELMDRWIAGTERVKPRAWNEMLTASAGNLKIIVVLLLLLTRPGQEVLIRGEVPRETGLSRGKRRVFLEHSSVSMRLERRAAVAKVLSGIGSGTHRRRHPVRGHWCQSRKVGRGCDHVWRIIDEDHFECGCGARRWWRENCWRGKFDEGFVSREGYDVHR